MKHYLDLVPIFARIHRKQNKMSIICIIYGEMSENKDTK